MIINLLDTNLNSRFLFKQKKYSNNSNNISFGLNENNKAALSKLRRNIEDRISIIQSIDMEDPDIEPCLAEFSHIVSENYSNSREMNLILDKLNAAGSRTGIKDCLSSFINCWIKLFLSSRAKASELMDRLKMPHPPAGYLSRTATNPMFKDTALRNIQNAQKYIIENVKQGVCPDKNLIISLHKIITEDLPFTAQDGRKYDCSSYSGIIRKLENDETQTGSKNADCNERLDDFMSWLKRNYNKDDTFQLAAQSYKKLLGICPFYDANGRTIRSFIDALLYSKGYRFKEYPANYAEVRNMKTEDLKKIFEGNCGKLTVNVLS